MIPWSGLKADIAVSAIVNLKGKFLPQLYTFMQLFITKQSGIFVGPENVLFLDFVQNSIGVAGQDIESRSNPSSRKVVVVKVNHETHKILNSQCY